MTQRNKAITKKIQDTLTPEKVLQDLMDGNQRFLNSKAITVDTKTLISQTATAQHPKAIILSCIDARVPVEILFDQTIGDVFVTRIAGNFENSDILGGMEFACKITGSKLVLVLGHEDCGAIKAACNEVKMGNITAMLSNITPAIEQTKKEVKLDVSHKNFIKQTAKNNVLLTIKRVREKSPILKELEEKGKIKIVGGFYKTATGKVSLL